MFLFNVYMYVIYISTCIDIINSVYLLLYLIALHFASRRLLVINQGQAVNNKKTTTTTIKKQKKSTAANSLWHICIFTF